MAEGKAPCEGTESPSCQEEIYFSKPTETHLIEADIADCLPQIFSDLWRSEKRCDLTLISGGEHFEVHSLILYAYSAYIADLIDKSS